MSTKSSFMLRNAATYISPEISASQPTEQFG